MSRLIGRCQHKCNLLGKWFMMEWLTLVSGPFTTISLVCGCHLVRPVQGRLSNVIFFCLCLQHVREKQKCPRSAGSKLSPYVTETFVFRLSKANLYLGGLFLKLQNAELVAHGCTCWPAWHAVLLIVLFPFHVVANSRDIKCPTILVDS